MPEIQSVYITIVRLGLVLVYKSFVLTVSLIIRAVAMETSLAGYTEQYIKYKHDLRQNDILPYFISQLKMSDNFLND